MLVPKLCPTLCDPMDAAGSSVHVILQAKILEWVAIPISRGSSRLRGWTRVSGVAGWFFTVWATMEAQLISYCTAISSQFLKRSSQVLQVQLDLLLPSPLIHTHCAGVQLSFLSFLPLWKYHLVSPWCCNSATFNQRMTLQFPQLYLDFSGGRVVKNLLPHAGDVSSIPGLGRSPGGGNDNPLQYSCLGNPMDRGAWWATVQGPPRVRRDWATEHTHDGNTLPPPPTLFHER